MNFFKKYFEKQAQKRDLALREAVLRNDVQALRRLIKPTLFVRGADVNAEHWGDRPLHIAAKMNYVECIKELIKAGADGQKLDRNFDTPIHIAVKYDHKEALLACIEAGLTDVTALNGKTALAQAITCRNSLLGRVLLEKGANPNIADNQGITPLELATHTGNKNFIRQMLDCGADVQQVDLERVFRARAWGALDVLLEKGATLKPNKNQNTLLHFFATQKNIDKDCDISHTVRLLLNAGVDINAQNVDGDTSLHIATKVGNFEIAQTLLNNGADRTIVNKAGQTPLTVAARDKNEQLMRLYLSLDVVIEKKNVAPIQIIRSSEHPEHILTLHAENIKD